MALTFLTQAADYSTQSKQQEKDDRGDTLKWNMNSSYLLQMWHKSKSFWCSGSRTQVHMGQLRAGSWFWMQFSHSRLVWCHCLLCLVPHWTHTLQFWRPKIKVFFVSETLKTYSKRMQFSELLNLWSSFEDFTFGFYESFWIKETNLQQSN